MPMRRRIYIAILAVLASLVLSVLKLLVLPGPVNDFQVPICGARALLHGLDPYSGICTIGAEQDAYATYPMTAILAVMPFTVFGNQTSNAIFVWAAINGLLAFALLHDNRPWRLLLFTSAVYWQAFDTYQWSPFITAIAFMPGLLPLALVKPHTGLAVILTNLTRRRALGLAAFLLLSLAVYPTWPLRWLTQARSYDGYIPLLAMPLGLLVLLAMVRWREKRAWFYLLTAAVPQRGLYDPLALGWLAGNPRQMLFLAAMSWSAFLPGLGWLTRYIPPFLLSVYLPALVLVLFPNFLAEPFPFNLQWKLTRARASDD